MRQMEEPQSLCNGRYRDLIVLRRGHFGTVYDANDISTGQRVAVKVLTLDGSHREVAEEMVRREVGALEGFNHPAVAKLIGHFEERPAGRLGIVLELVPGRRNLETLITDVRAGSEEARSFRWCVEQLGCLLDGIDRAHQRRIIHRDIKPSNVLFHRDEDSLKLADFGVALLLENFGRGDSGKTLREFYTRPFAAPEQVLKLGAATPATDLHAFGLLAASLLSWHLPSDDFKREDLSHLLEPVRRDLPDPALYQKLCGTLSSLLNPQPELRPRLAEVARLFQELLERTTVRTVVRVRVTRCEKARAAGFTSPAKILADLNGGLRGRYDVVPAHDGKPEGYKIRFWGKTLSALAVPSEPGSDQLLIVDASAHPPAQHERQKEDQTHLPFELVLGTGDGLELVQFVYGEHLRKRQEEEARRKQDSLFSVAEKVLEKERQRLARVLIKYELLPETKAKPKSLGTLGEKMKLAGIVPSGESTAGSVPDKYRPKSGELLRMKVVLASIPIDDQGRATELGEDWHEDFDETNSFYSEDSELGKFYRYDDSTQTLIIRVSHPMDLPGRGVLESKDIGTETSLDRQESALSQLYRDTCVNPRLRHLLLFPEQNRVGEIRPLQLFQELEPRDTVRDMVERAIAAEDFFFLQGPPGTGKTTFISEVMAQILAARPDSRVLLASQANEAVDNAIDALRTLAGTSEWRIVRYHGNQKDEEGVGFGVVFREWVEKVRQRSSAGLAKLEETGSAVDLEAARKAVTAWQERLTKFDDAREDFASTVHVFGVTCLKVPALSRKLLREVEFDRVIVDEAAKATPTEVLVSLTFGHRFILVGDHKQLPPYLDSTTEEELRAEGVDPQRARKSLFEDLFDRIPETNRATLRRQFRMHRSIGHLVGELYYSDVGGLEHGVKDEERTLELSLFNREDRVFWLDVHGHEKADDTSWWNREEIDVIRRLLDRFEAELAGIKGRTVQYPCGIIAPYTAQRSRLDSRIVPSSKQWTRIVPQVATVDAFQGRQKDIIVYSMVRVGEGEKRWVSDPQRLNVAFSRARRLLVIVGHKESALRSERLARVLMRIQPKNIIAAEELR